MEPNLHITLKVSRFAPDTPHDSVVALFRHIERAAKEIATASELEVRASWSPVPDPLELDAERRPTESLRVGAADHVSGWRSHELEADRTRRALADDPTVTPAELGALVESADEADRARELEAERESSDERLERRRENEQTIAEYRALFETADALGIELPRSDRYDTARLQAAADELGIELPRRRARCSS